VKLLLVPHAQSGSGNWTIRHVIPPDEAAGVVSDSAYTNAAAAKALAACAEFAAALGQPVEPLWRQIPAALYLPLVRSPPGRCPCLHIVHATNSEPDSLAA
jgi:trehalose/maltose hydrolase-like predicted phosphorylase